MHAHMHNRLRTAPLTPPPPIQMLPPPIHLPQPPPPPPMPPKLSRVSDVRLPPPVIKDFKNLCQSFDMSPDAIAASVARVGPHVNKPLINGQTPLFFAVVNAANASQDLALVHALLSRDDVQVDAASDPDGDTPLISAVAAGRGDLVDVLLRAGADPCACNDAGDSALCKAATNPDRSEVFERLLQVAGRKGVEIKRKNGGKGTTLLHLAAEEECVAQLQLLLQSFPELASALDDVPPPPPTPCLPLLRCIIMQSFSSFPTI